MIGEKFLGRYEIVSKLGSGGMAVVYKAVDTVLNRMVTVKILQEQFASNQQFVIRFRKEAQAVAALSSHPNIVNVFDVGCSEDGDHYLIMEYVEGETLKEVINKNGSLSVKESLDYTNQILAGLSHAHSYGVIHRDIKPQNIIITHGNQVKIMDFGLAMNLSDSTMTYDASVFGSVYYIAPEIAQKGMGDARADIYSTGIVLYEMLTGELPFSGDSPITIALQHVEGEYDSVDDIDDEIPYEVARVVDKAMSVDPQERYSSAKAMMRGVKDAADENDIPLKAIAVIAGAGRKPQGVAAAESKPVRNRRRMEETEDDYDFDAMEEEYRGKKGRRTSSAPSSSRSRTRAAAEKKKKKKKIIAIVVLSALVLGLGIFAGVKAFSNTGGEVEVPMLEGKSVSEATSILDQLDLKYNITTKESEDVEVDIVISQNPEAGQKVKAGRTIDIVVSSGTEAVDVPDVTGKTKDAAKTILEKAGFNVTIKEDFSDEVEEGDVISQTPESGEKAGKGSTVKIVVSTGPEEKMIAVPDVTGLTLDDAKKQIVDAKLKVGSVTEKNSDSVEEGKVMYQSVKGGTEVKEGSGVNLTVSKGSATPTSKTTSYSNTVSSDYDGSVSIKITVEDSKSSRTVYSGTAAAGENVSVSVTYYPPGILSYYENGSLIDTKSLN